MLIAGAIVVYLVIGLIVAMGPFSKMPAERSMMALKCPLLFILVTAILWPLYLLIRNRNRLPFASPRDRSL